ncbi:DUF2242 domain-containing protein [Diaphorobacter aerolatus]|uniref:DUF2242 domain-containing protein n=1 Tax=Diaphorobacter aerolatus TaxID=1288495 RepID=A0A7H0GMC6_9BURK|nr:DUF2242 domain-containing protein [Diaphorobacter aerolatus]QNP49442.1 DUF2242 domain-containing protein [Diaphorobacter aerolatus]
MFQPRFSFWLAAGVVVGSAALTGCSSLPSSMPGLERPVAFSPADFDNTGMYTRHVAASQSRTCEAARRALLSQGYLVNTATDELVTGRKYFQPTNDIHYQVEMRVVCAVDGKNDEKTAAYASALQDRYVIKKINNSASLGVGAIGSLSLPVSATEDTLVKVGSETVSDPRFYELFFQLFDRYVPTALPQSGSTLSRSPAVPSGAEKSTPNARPQTQPVTASPVQPYEVIKPAPAPVVELAAPEAAEPKPQRSSIDTIIEGLMAEQRANEAKAASDDKRDATPASEPGQKP